MDRPSFLDPDDPEQSSQDRESRSNEPPPAEPWSPADPWQETRREPPGWDDWPPATPPPDDYYVEPGPSQDLWAESWEDEAASDLPRAGYEPVHVDEEPFGPAPIAEPPYAPEPEAPAPPDEPSAYRPDVADAFAAPPSPPWPANDAIETPPTEPVAPEARPEPPLPDWLAEPLREPAAEPEPEPGEQLAATDPEVPSWLDVGPQYALPPFLEVDEPEPDEPEPMPEYTPPAAAEPEPEVAAVEDVQPATTWESDAAERWQAWEAEAQPSVEDLAPIAPPDVVPPPAPLWEPEPVADERATVEPALEEPAADVAEPEAAEPAGAAEPEAAPAETGGWEPAGWSGEDESTRVLPTDWTPPPAPPPSPAEGEAAAELEPIEGEVRTSLSEPDVDLEAQPATTTAEQAVPWLIGLILLLAGMVIVLLALIFAGPQSLGAPSPSPSASAAGVLPSPTPRASATAEPSASATAAPTPTPIPVPEYGPLEMIYQGRAAALAPIYLLLHDFTTEDEAVVLAQDPTIDVRRFAWAPDGTVGAGLLADVLVSIEIGESKRNLGEGLITVTFGEDTSTLYALRVTADGTNDVATILAVDFASGDSSELASVTYPRPDIASEPALPEAQFTDEGGTVRLFWMSDATLRLWVLGASTWQIDPESGDVTDLEGDELPVLTDPDGTHTIDLVAAEDSSETTVRYLDADGDVLATTTAPGLVSHLRWSRGGDRVVFTVGRAASGGGVLQDLFLWDLETGVAPTQITNTGAAFGAEWRGAAPRWEAGP